MSRDILVLAYAKCDTCRRALKALDARGARYELRSITDAPPTPTELARWIPKSGVGVRRWLNTSGQSYRARGKAAFDAASDAEIASMLAADGKLVKRPVLVRRAPGANASDVREVLVGFSEDAYARVLDEDACEARQNG